MSDFLTEVERLRERRQAFLDANIPCPIHEKITKNNWPESWAKVPTWTEIDEEIYEHFLNVLPPISFGSWDSLKTGYFQCSEPYSHEEYRGKWQGKYLTFYKREGTFWFLGIQFKGHMPDWRERNHA